MSVLNQYQTSSELLSNETNDQIQYHIGVESFLIKREKSIKSESIQCQISVDSVSSQYWISFESK